MTRPPLIRTDMRISPLGRSLLLAARGDRDVLLLPVLAVDVEALGLEHRIRRLGEVGAVRLVTRKLLELAVRLHDARRALVRDRVHDPDPSRRRPDECVDLVHLPRLVALRECWTVLEDDAGAVGEMGPAVDPTLERCREELLRDRLVRRVL